MSEAYEHLKIAEHIYQHDKHQGHAFVYGQNPYMASLSYSAITRWWLGSSDEGGKLADQAIEFARGISHPRSLAFALANGARCHLKRSDLERTIETGKEAAAVSDQYGFPDFSAMGKFHQRVAEFWLNENDETLRLMQISLNDLMHVGNSLSMPYYHSVMADCLSKRGQFENAKQHISQAQDALSKHTMDTDEAEFFRVKGLVLLREAKQTGDDSILAEAKKWLEHAVSIATEQGAICWQQQAVSTLTEVSMNKERKYGTS
jgi:tetratricopeptide (TPR) repeat protein